MATQISFDKFYNIVDNQRLSADRTSHGINPNTEEPLWEVPVATEHDLDKAVAAANVAFKTWSARPIEERSSLLKQVAEGIRKYKPQFSELLHKEGGKTMGFAELEVEDAIGTIMLHAGWTIPEEVLSDTDTLRVVVQHVPMGVVGGITPWNFPFQLPILKFAASLMAGCPIIIKPSPFTPYCALKIVEVASQHLPPGVLQVLAGDDTLGPLLTNHPGIAKISFTGSIATGKKVMAAASSTLKRVNLELGGNDAAIVTDDVDISEAVQLIAPACFAHSGQICISSKRVFVHESIYEDFLSKFVGVVKGYKTGEGYISPIQNKMQYEKVKSIYKDCGENSYEFVVGNGKTFTDDSRPGYYIDPAVIANPPDNSRIVREEPFGPIVPILKWSNDQEVIDRANDTSMGLGGTVFCRDERRATKIAEGLETGSVWINSGVKIAPVGTFGTHKQSGIGGEFGQHGLLYYTNLRTVTTWKDANAKAAEANSSKGGLFA